VPAPLLRENCNNRPRPRPRPRVPPAPLRSQVSTKRWMTCVSGLPPWGDPVGTYGPSACKSFCVPVFFSLLQRIRPQGEAKGQDGDPRDPVLIMLSAFLRPFKLPGFQVAISTVRPSRVHLSQTSSVHRCVTPQDRPNLTPLCWRERRRRRSCPLAPASSSPSATAAYLSAQGAGEPPERHGSTAFADICFLAC
jgi:hypothetical protein